MQDRHGPPSGRIPPQATEVEQSLLGACMLEQEVFWQASELLTAEDFYAAKHRKVWNAMADLSARNIELDLVSVSEALKKAGHLEDVGGSYYLTELTSNVSTTANVEHWAHIVKEKSMLRMCITVSMKMAGDAYDPAADAFEVVEEAERAIMSVQPEVRQSLRLPDILKKSLVDLERKHGAEQKVTGIPLGLRKIDEMTTGWQNGDMVIIAARPSMGKTALALKALYEAAKDGVPSAFFTMEMTAGQLAERLLCSTARVDAQRARQGRLQDDDWVRLARAAGKLAELPVHIDDTPSLSITQLRAKLRRLKIDEDIGLAVLDYLQLMEASLGKNSNRENEIAYISRHVKGLAKELDIPIIALSQLSRACENRGGMMRPRLSDLRESGGIEQDCDVAIFVYRAEKYDIQQDENGVPTMGVAELIIEKQRRGPIGTRHVAFVSKYVTFENKQPQLAFGHDAPDDYTESKRPSAGDAPF